MTRAADVTPGRAVQEMVERVARALWDQALTLPDVEGKPVPHGFDWKKEDQDVRDHYQGMARAAIAAMREPTKGMVRVGIDIAFKVSLGDGYQWPHYIADKHRAMIDAALADAPAPRSDA